MTNEDVEALEFLARRLQRRYGTEVASKLVMSMLMKQTESALKPDGADHFRMDMLTREGVNPAVRQWLRTDLKPDA